MAEERKVPMRTCIACRKETARRELLRIVRSPSGEVSLDFSGRLPGRGAYVCKTEACIKLLAKKKPLARVFNVPVPDEVYRRIEEEFLVAKD